MTGGLSGPAIKPIALRMVYEVARSLSVPVIGMGGIMSADDAIEFLIAGAQAVQIGTANFKKPAVALDVISGIRAHLMEEKLDGVSRIIGSLEAKRN